MASTEAMRLFVKILEEEDPGWYSRDSNFVSEPAVLGEKNTVMIAEPVTENGNVLPEIKTIPAENGNLSEPQDKDVVSEGVGAVGGYDQWVSPPISGPRPKARYEHGTAVIDDKMYIFGGNHNGWYLSDLQALDLRSWTWSNVEVKTSGEASQVPAASFTGHSVIPWQGNKLISIGGHTKDPSETMQVRVFDLQTLTWSNLKTYGKPPLSRGGHSVTPAGTSLAIFGGQDANRSLLNDLHILDLETMTWNEMDTF
ncbi:Acyl-CoA-binding domain-containing protein 4 [Capsicum chinense]|nr:Acyl-CoA-binding domain-containing protein 4 [Capsicum chinense]